MHTERFWKQKATIEKGLKSCWWVNSISLVTRNYAEEVSVMERTFDTRSKTITLQA